MEPIRETQLAERRKMRRYAVAVEARLQTVRPEGGRTVTFDAVMVDLTAIGARVVVFKMPRRDYLQLVNGDRLPYAQVFCTFPNQKAPSTLFGKVTYVDYREAAPESCCQVGIKFGRMDVRDLKRLQEYLASL